ncbi:Dual specificity protein phosphatase 14 [Perkinsus olseni]|uniref:Dual specificity protein phosphatase 14 n=1 Tax=Perkinsus olseni TaxID=32597 RepID=A0A7J6N6W0_PEROL|nr:Dual specificity protein phosphatase 14 [Perkinsus olseni]
MNLFDTPKVMQPTYLGQLSLEGFTRAQNAFNNSAIVCSDKGAGIVYNSGYSVVILRSRSTRNEIIDKAIADHLHRVRSVEFGCDDDGDDPLETVEIFLDDEVDDAAVAALGRILSPGPPAAELCLESLVRTTDNPAWNDEYAAMSKVSRTGPEASGDTMKMTHVADFDPGLNGGKAEAKTEVYCYPRCRVLRSANAVDSSQMSLKKAKFFIIFVPRRNQLVFWVGEGSAQPPDHRIETIRKSLCQRHDLDESSVEVEIVYQGEEMEDFEEYFDDD